MKRGREGTFGAALFLTALAVALAYNVLAVGQRGPHPTSDALEYNLLGRTLARGEGLIGTKRTPVFPAFLGAVYFLVGVNHFVTRVLLSVMAAAAWLFIYLLGRETVGEKAARWAVPRRAPPTGSRGARRVVNRMPPRVRRARVPRGGTRSPPASSWVWLP